MLQLVSFTSVHCTIYRYIAQRHQCVNIPVLTISTEAINVRWILREAFISQMKPSHVSASSRLKAILATSSIILQWISRTNHICRIILGRALKAGWWEKHVDGIQEIQFWEGLHDALWSRIDWQENWISRLPIRRAGFMQCTVQLQGMLIMIASSSLYVGL